MKIGRFEDIEGWQKARDLVRIVYQITTDGKLVRDFGLKEQIQRSSVSIMSNIAEGFGRQTDREFIQFLIIARASAYELQSHLYIAFDLCYINQPQFKNIYEEITSVIKLINGFIRYLRATKRP